MQNNEPNVDIGFATTLRNASRRDEIVRFPISPVVTESRSVQYQKSDIKHLPGDMLSYTNTSARKFEFSDLKLVSRTPIEARRNLVRLNTLRGWTLPYFGSTGLSTLDDSYLNRATNADDTSKQVDQLRSNFRRLLGAPPDVLHLFAYSGGSDDAYLGNINGIPTVIESLTITYPNDVDYIPCQSNGANDPYGGTPFPIIMNLSLSLSEIHSPREFEKFKLEDFKTGRMLRF